MSDEVLVECECNSEFSVKNPSNTAGKRLFNACTQNMKLVQHLNEIHSIFY